MEFPHLGKQCMMKTCNKLDFLPIKCDGCKQIFCNEHYSYTNHDCPTAYKKNNQVPVCPLCNIPIPVGPNQQPDFEVGAHIDNDCKSRPQSKVFTNKCSFKGCKNREVIPITCNECTLNYCLKHRHTTDHKCEGQKAARRHRALEAALSRNSNNKSSNYFNHTQGSLSEDEALARALALSMQETTVRKTQEELDLALARQLQASENQTTASASHSRDRCNVS